MTIDDGQIIDLFQLHLYYCQLISPPVDLPLHLTLTPEQYPQMLETPSESQSQPQSSKL